LLAARAGLDWSETSTWCGDGVGGVDGEAKGGGGGGTGFCMKI